MWDAGNILNEILRWFKFFFLCLASLVCPEVTVNLWNETQNIRNETSHRYKFMETEDCALIDRIFEFLMSSDSKCVRQGTECFEWDNALVCIYDFTLPLKESRSFIKFWNQYMSRTTVNFEWDIASVCLHLKLPLCFNWRVYIYATLTLHYGWSFMQGFARNTSAQNDAVFI